MLTATFQAAKRTFYRRFTLPLFALFAANCRHGIGQVFSRRMHIYPLDGFLTPFLARFEKSLPSKMTAGFDPSKHARQHRPLTPLWGSSSFTGDSHILHITCLPISRNLAVIGSVPTLYSKRIISPLLCPVSAISEAVNTCSLTAVILIPFLLPAPTIQDKIVLLGRWRSLAVF